MLIISSISVRFFYCITLVVNWLGFFALLSVELINKFFVGRTSFVCISSRARFRHMQIDHKRSFFLCFLAVFLLVHRHKKSKNRLKILCEIFSISQTTQIYNLCIVRSSNKCYSTSSSSFLFVCLFILLCFALFADAFSVYPSCRRIFVVMIRNSHVC